MSESINVNWTPGPPPGSGEYWVEWSDGTVDPAWVGPSALCPDRLHVKTFRGDLFPDRDAGKDIVRHAPLTRPEQSPGRTLEPRQPRTWPAPLAEHVAGLRQLEQLAASFAVDDDGILRALGVGLGGTLDWLAELLCGVDEAWLAEAPDFRPCRPYRKALPVCYEAAEALDHLARIEGAMRHSGDLGPRGRTVGVALDLLYELVLAVESRQDWLERREEK